MDTAKTKQTILDVTRLMERFDEGSPDYIALANVVREMTARLKMQANAEGLVDSIRELKSYSELLEKRNKELETYLRRTSEMYNATVAEFNEKLARVKQDAYAEGFLDGSKPLRVGDEIIIDGSLWVVISQYPDQFGECVTLINELGSLRTRRLRKNESYTRTGKFHPEVVVASDRDIKEDTI